MLLLLFISRRGRGRCCCCRCCCCCCCFQALWRIFESKDAQDLQSWTYPTPLRISTMWLTCDPKQDRVSCQTPKGSFVSVDCFDQNTSLLRNQEIEGKSRWNGARRTFWSKGFVMFLAFVGSHARSVPVLSADTSSEYLNTSLKCQRLLVPQPKHRANLNTRSQISRAFFSRCVKFLMIAKPPAAYKQ